jgi:hypothetical protein
MAKKAAARRNYETVNIRGNRSRIRRRKRPKSGRRSVLVCGSEQIPESEALYEKENKKMSQSIPVAFVSQYKGKKNMAKPSWIVAKEGIAAQLKKKKEKEKYPTIISGSQQDPNDPNVIRGDKEGAYVGPERKKKPKRFWRGLMRMVGRG